MPRVKALYEKYHSKGFEIVGVSLDNDKAAWTGAIQRMNLPWPHLSDLKGWQSEAAALYGISSIPATMLVDPQARSWNSVCAANNSKSNWPNSMPTPPMCRPPRPTP